CVYQIPAASSQMENAPERIAGVPAGARRTDEKIRSAHLGIGTLAADIEAEAPPRIGRHHRHLVPARCERTTEVRGTLPRSDPRGVVIQVEDPQQWSSFGGGCARPAMDIRNGEGGWRNETRRVPVGGAGVHRSCW